MGGSPEDSDLAESIRKSERPFVDAMLKGCREAIATEYYRMRGYAVESGVPKVTLRLEIECDFSEDARTVQVSSAPVFTPPVQTTKVRVKG